MAQPERSRPAKWQIWKLLLPPAGYPYFSDWEKFEFEPDAREHSAINAWWLAECALLAYEDAPNVAAALETVGVFRKGDRLVWQWLDQSGSQGFIVEAQRFVLLSMRGTEFYPFNTILKNPRRLWSVAEDIRTDIDLVLQKPNGRPAVETPVARGFYRALQSVWEFIKSFVEAAPDKPLWLTGHSLGAAIATLVADHYGASRVAGLYTYGSPCVGGDAFAEAFADKGLESVTFRYVNGKDLIAKSMPLWRERMGRPDYQHVGTLKTLQAQASLLDWLTPMDLLDHAPIYYALQTWNTIP